MTKSETYQELANETSLTKKQVAAVFESLVKLVRRELGKNRPGVVTIPGLLKIKRVHKPATKARKGRNPATGEEMMIKPKPARNVVKVRALKDLAEMVK